MILFSRVLASDLPRKRSIKTENLSHFGQKSKTFEK